MRKVCNLVLVGVGGQGILGTGRLLGQAATDAGLDVRVGQIYGLSQRGGSVEASIRIGAVSTPVIARNGADVVLGLEPLETERALPQMSVDTIVLVNKTPIVPTSLTLGRSSYPEFESILDSLRATTGWVYPIDGNTLASQAGDPRLLNSVMLGALDGLGALPIPTEALVSAVEHRGSGSDPVSRVAAFHLGREFGVGAIGETSVHGRDAVIS